MATSTLTAIRTKIRRLTHSPSESLITNDQIDEYVNTFIAYDFPEQLRLFSLKRTLTFYTEPYRDVYKTNTTVGDPLYNFKNATITVNAPVYIAGYKSYFSQSRSEFFDIFPFINSVTATQFTGDGSTVNFSGTLSATPILRSNVTFSTLDGSNNGLVAYDDGEGNIVGDALGTIDYVTGAYTLVYSTPPGSGQTIFSETVPYVAAQPDSVLYFNDEFTVRPVPDKPYPINIEVFVQPTQLIADSDTPYLEQWWQYIAYGAAKKIFEDKMDMESVKMIMPEFKQQERFVLRRTLVQQSTQRSATIYVNQVDFNGDGWGGQYNNF